MKEFGTNFNEALEECGMNILGCEDQRFVNELRSFFLDNGEHPIKKEWIEKFVKKNNPEKDKLNLENYLMIKDAPKIAESEYVSHRVPVQSGDSNKMIEDIQNSNAIRYYDGMFDFVLFSGKKPLASIGFNPAGGGILVQHIQGFKGASEFISPLKWTRLCLNYVVDWARRWDVPIVTCPSVDNNYYARKFYDHALRNDLLRYFYGFNITFRKAKTMPVRRDLIERFMDCHRNGERSRLTPHHGFIIYDVTAKNCGFKRELNNWVKKLRD